MTQQQRDIAWLMAKIGLVGTAVSIPIAWWALPKWREQPIIPALILTGVGLVIKEVMISHGEHEAPLEQELLAAPIHMNMGG